MSHLPERKEKICLNCKSVIYGRYCHICGQENTEPKETFWGLITHFIYDITHFDGKFFATTKYLLFRPGYLAAEYLRGRRASYLNPIRMYVFTSAFFFILFFSFIFDPAGKNEAERVEKRNELIAERKLLDSTINQVTDSAQRTALRKKIKKLNDRIRFLEQEGFVLIGDDRPEDSASDSRVFGGKELPRTVREYDSIQQAAPAGKKHGWFKRTATRRMISVNERYRYRHSQFWNDVQTKFMHSLPQMMFVSLPLVALLWKLLYFRRKQYYFVNHVIFTVYLYIAAYLLLLLLYGFSGLSDITGFALFKWLAIGSWLAIFLYIYKSMRNFYMQRRAKTIVKFLLFILLFMLLMTLLLSIYFFTSALQV